MLRKLGAVAVARVVPVRPNGVACSRTFTSEAAAWRAIVGGTNSRQEARERRARLEREGRWCEWLGTG